LAPLQPQRHRRRRRRWLGRRRVRHRDPRAARRGGRPVVAGGPASRYGDHDLGGACYAIVTQNDAPDGPGGRVPGRYPWLPEGDRDQSYWAPICVPMIGAEFGTYTLPDVDDEVVVVFLAGDINTPIVIGGGWSASDPPPENNADGKNDFRLIKSR